MLIVRFRQTFRERAPEWVMAYVQAGWGATLLLPGDPFSRPYFQTIATIASAQAWGWSLMGIGLVRLAALYVNGSRKETPTVRQVGCFFGMLIWAFLLMGGLAAPFRSPSIFTYSGLFLLEAIMFSYASRDAARLACKARGDGRR
jgi:hypothetical protein